MDGGCGYSRMDEELHPQLLDLISKERNWFPKRDDVDSTKGSGRNREDVCVSDEKKLELRLGPPGVEDWSLSVSDAPRNYKSPAAVPVPNTSQKRSAPAPVVGWPPIRSFRKNIAKQAPCSDGKKNTVEGCQKGFFVKINMNGVPIGRKVDLKAYDSYEKLSVAVDELFRGLVAAQKDTCTGNPEQEKAITGLLDGSGEYTLVYEDNEGDRMLVGDVPWHMFVSTVKRLRVIRSCEISNLCVGSKQEKTQVR